MESGLNKARMGHAGEAKLGKNSNIGKVGVTGHEGKRAKVVVLDLRKERAEAEQLREGSTGEKAAVARSDGKAGSAEGLEKDFSVLFRGNYPQRAPAPAAEAAQSGRAQVLPQRFQERFVPEVVKQTGIILKDGGAAALRASSALLGAPLPPPGAPRNWKRSMITRCLLRFCPSLLSQLSSCRRPSISIGLPFRMYWLRVSACLP